MIAEFIAIGIHVAFPLFGAPTSAEAEPRRDAVESVGLQIKDRMHTEAEIVATRDRLLTEVNEPKRIAIIHRNVQRWLDYPTLELFETRNTDAALAIVTTLPFFAPKMIQLYGSDITDQGLSHIVAEEQLEFLGLRFCVGITDDGIARLSSLPALRRLDLWNTRITDSSIEHLARMSQLQTIRIADTKITQAGVSRLQDALPNCDIYAD